MTMTATAAARTRESRRPRLLRVAIMRLPNAAIAKKPCRLTSSCWFSTISPLRIWLISYASRARNSSAFRACNAPWVTPTVASAALRPAAKALIPAAWRSTNACGSGIFAAVASSSISVSSRRSSTSALAALTDVPPNDSASAERLRNSRALRQVLKPKQEASSENNIRNTCSAAAGRCDPVPRSISSSRASSRNRAASAQPPTSQRVRCAAVGLLMISVATARATPS